MVTNVYSFYNYKIGAYMVPIFRVEDSDQIKEAVLRQVLSAKGPELAAILECELYMIGQFDDRSGAFKLAEKPVSLVDLRTLNLGEKGVGGNVEG